jgi:hypothetical protein
MTTTQARERRARIKRLERWFVQARASEKLLPTPEAYWAYAKKHPKHGVITAAMLYDLFRLAIDPE